MRRSCASSPSVASSSSTTTSAKSTAWSASATDSFSSLSCTLARLRMPAVSISRTWRALAVGSVPVPVDRDRIARDPRFGPGDQPVLAEHAVDQRRLARVRAPDDRQLQRRVGTRRPPRSSASPSSPLEMRQQRLEQVAHALAMLGRQLDRIAEAQRQRLEDARSRPRALPPCWRPARPGWSTPRSQRAISSSSGTMPGARVEQEQRDIGLRDRRLGLLRASGRAASAASWSS